MHYRDCSLITLNIRSNDDRFLSNKFIVFRVQVDPLVSLVPWKITAVDGAYYEQWSIILNCSPASLASGILA